MKRIIGTIREGLFIVIGSALLIGIFLGAILQESYKLCPINSAEVTEVNHD